MAQTVESDVPLLLGLFVNADTPQLPRKGGSEVSGAYYPGLAYPALENKIRFFRMVGILPHHFQNRLDIRWYGHGRAIFYHGSAFDLEGFKAAGINKIMLDGNNPLIT
jgi:hypothetical protein